METSARSLSPRSASLAKTYSSTTVLMLIMCQILFDGFVYEPLLQTIRVPSLYGSVSLALRAASTVSLFTVWLFKQDEYPKATAAEPKCVPWAQGAFPVFAILALAAHMARGLYLGTSSGPATMTAHSGLRSIPLILFFVLRDTHHVAIWTTWFISCATQLLFCMHHKSVDSYMSLLMYAFVLGSTSYETMRHSAAMNNLVTRLQETLAENERLAVEAQALELRAMIGNVAHDLKTPLTSILSGIECMTEVVTSWERQLATSADAASATAFAAAATENFRALRNCLKNMHGSNSFMTMTINRCIDYTKASKGVKLVPKMATVTLQVKLEMPVQLMRYTQSAITVTILPYSADICTHIITDQQWLLENLLCLLSNAVKYSHKGTVEVGVSLEGAPSEPQFLRFEVQDSGVGLSEEAMQTLFNPFKQAQRLAGGTGLGLFSLAKRVEALSGQYGVSRRPDGCQGSVFWFTIPYRPDQLSADVVHAEIKKRSAAANEVDSEGDSCHHSLLPFRITTTCLDVHTIGSLPPQCVLVVDDAPLIVKMTTVLLSRKGHTVESAVNGADALEKLLQGYERAHSAVEPPEGARIDTAEYSTPYDVVLMDLQMPVLDGIEAIRRLRAAERGWQGGQGAQEAGEQANPSALRSSHQMVIALSANSDEETRLAALEAGADAFMAKPFTYENFLEVMRHRQEK